MNAQPVLPTKPEKRIEIVDIWRGFAILGILVVNMELFSHAIQTVSYGIETTNPIDQIARWLIAFFGEGKFYSTFALLFGLGFAIQQQRIEARGGRFFPLYLRRLAILLAFGLIHAYLLWAGDILILYSVLGLILLLFFRNRRPRTLLIWFFILLAVPLLLNGALWGVVSFGRQTPEGAQMVAQILQEQETGLRAAAAAADEVYASGTFLEITRQRVADMNYLYSVYPFMGFNVLAMFVLGLYAGKRRLHALLPDQPDRLRRILTWGLALGITGNLLYVIFGEWSSRIIPSGFLMISITAQTIGAPALAVAYMAGLALLAPRFPSLSRLAPVGRMALTNYLLQSVICVTLFYGTGFGLYGQLGQAAGLLLTLGIFLLQIPFSSWWLTRYRFGPMEWLWRTLTYRQRQPMQRPSLAS